MRHWTVYGDLAPSPFSSSSMNLFSRLSANKAPISSFTITRYPIANYSIEAKIPNKEIYHQLSLRLANLGYHISLIDTWQQFVRLNTSELGHLKQLLLVFQHVDLHFAEVNQRLFQQIGIDRRQQYPLPNWMTFANNHDQSFEQLGSGRLIKKIHIVQSSVADPIILVIPQDEQYFEAISKFNTVGYPIQRLSNPFKKELLLQTANLGHINQFLTAIRAIEPSVEDILPRLHAQLGINPAQNYPVPTWITAVETHFNPWHQRSRHLRMSNLDPNAQITQLSFYGNSHHGFDVTIAASAPQAYQNLTRSLNGNAFQFQAHGNFSMSLSDRHRPLELLDTLQAVEPQLQSIRDQILLEINTPARRAPLPRAVRMRSLEQVLEASVLDAYPEPDIPPPPTSTQQLKIDTIQAQREKQNLSLLEIPAEFYCKLSEQVMTEPVKLSTLPKTSDSRFERSQILNAIARKPQCPYTNKPLDATQLTPDLPLQNRISAFITQAEKPASFTPQFRRRRISPQEVRMLEQEAENFTKRMKRS